MKPEYEQRLWRDVHGELDADGQRELQAALDSDAELRRQLEDVRQTHAALRDLMPRVDRSDDDLIDAVVAAYEADEEPAAPVEGAGRPQASRIRLPRLLSLAAAAALVIFIGGLVMFPSPIQWSIETRPLQYRDDAPESRVYQARDLAGFAESIKSAVNDRYRKKPRWKISLMVQELPGGALRLEVSATPHGDTAAASTWDQVIENDEIQDGLTLLSENIAATVASPPPDRRE